MMPSPETAPETATPPLGAEALSEAEQRHDFAVVHGTVSASENLINTCVTDRLQLIAALGRSPSDQGDFPAMAALNGETPNHLKLCLSAAYDTDFQHDLIGEEDGYDLLHWGVLDVKADNPYHIMRLVGFRRDAVV